MPEQDTASTQPPRTVGLGWYAVALVVYVALGYANKGVLLHWTEGPLFLLIALYIVPAGVRWLRARTRAAR